MWTPRLAASDKPVFQLIADAMEADIAAERLKPGDQLPTHRALAQQLKLTVRTVTRAYSEAERRGLTEGQIGRGTFVRTGATAARREPAASGTEPRVVDLSSSAPPASIAAESLAEALRALSRRGGLDRLVGYPPGIGQARHRAAGAAWLARGDWKPAPEQVALCVGAQHGLLVALGALAGPRRVVLTEALGYPGIRRAAELLHLDVQGVPIDDQGMRPDALEALIRKMRPAAVVVTPTAHNPTCSTMPEPRRLAIAKVLNATGVTLIEDDLLSPLAGDGLPLLVQLVEGRSFYIGGTSKCIAPGLRIAFLVARAEDMPHVAASIYASAVSAPPLMAEIATLWIENGTAGRHLEWHRQEARERVGIARQSLAGLAFRAQAGCYHIWLLLPESCRVNELVAQAAAHGVVVTPAAAFAIGGPDVPSTPNAVRIGLGATQSQRDLATALKTLAGLTRAGAAEGWRIV